MPELTKDEAMAFQHKMGLVEGRLIIWLVQHRTEEGERYVGVPFLPPNQSPRSEDGYLIAPTLAELRDLLPDGLTRVGPHAGDHDSVLEYWF